MTTLPSTRQQILSAAEREFLEKGYEAASVREITRRAGVTTGALYGSFKNKQELFAALVDTQYHRMIEMYDEVLKQFHTLPLPDQTSCMREYTGRCMDAMARYIYDNWNAFKLILCRSEGTPYSRLVEEMVARDIQATDDFSQASLDAGIPLQKINPTLERMLLTGMFSTFFEMVRQDLPREETNQYISQLLDFHTAGWERLWSF